MNTGRYIIERTDQGGGMVAISNNESSYTNNLRKARRFATKEDAEKERCPDNEIIVDLFDLIFR